MRAYEGTKDTRRTKRNTKFNQKPENEQNKNNNM
jgi:hypothetical protein